MIRPIYNLVPDCTKIINTYINICVGTMQFMNCCRLQRNKLVWMICC